MKKNYFVSLVLMLLGLFSSTKTMAEVDWNGASLTVTAQYEDGVGGDLKDDEFKLTIGKDGNDMVVTSFAGYTDILYGGLLASVDKTDSNKLNIICDNIQFISTEDERLDGIRKYISLRDADGGSNNIVLTSLGNGKYDLSPFTIIQKQDGVADQVLRRYTKIVNVTDGTGTDEPEVKTKWEKLYALPSCYAFHIDSKTGNFLASDFRDDLKGGIYYSTDRGETWTKTKVADHNYNKFYETDKYIFALGYGARIARSEDGGKTWEMLNYKKVIADIVSTEDMDYDAAYDMVQVGNRIYVADYAGGVIYSEDYGETWTHTADDIFLEVTEGKQGIETIHNVLYGLTEYNGKILAMGLYYVYEYDAENDAWQIVRWDSNLMAIHCNHHGVLYCGRSMPNDGLRNPFLEYTTDGVCWDLCNHPNTEDNNVRALGSNGVHLVVGLQSTGILYTDDDCETWYEMDLDGLPLRYPGLASQTSQKLTPLSIEFDSEYVYVAFFGDNPNTEPGIWRYPLSELHTPTAIASTKAHQPAAAQKAYDLQGRPVAKGYKGIVVRNGKLLAQ